VGSRRQIERDMDEPARVRHSLVVPAYNEARCLPPLLDSVDTARSSYARGAAAVEVIVADNASTDATAAIARSRGCSVVHVEKRCIAAARNGGARAARGEILAFVDADTRIHPSTFDAVDRVLERGGAVAGATGVTLERWSLGLALTYAALLPAVWLTGMDTGVVFCRREDFAAVGGYDEGRRVAEDVAFLLALRRLGRRRGERLRRTRGAKAVASTRKFDEHGDWHWWWWMMPRLPLALLTRGRSAEDWIDRYWYRPGR
jgi:glycosyltransferase involved in cell wall biosynthesis